MRISRIPTNGNHAPGWWYRWIIVVLVLVAIAWQVEPRHIRILYVDFVLGEKVVFAVSDSETTTGTGTTTTTPFFDARQKAAMAKLAQWGEEPLWTPQDDEENNNKKKNKNDDDNAVVPPETIDLLLRLDRIRARCGVLCALNSQAAMDQYNILPSQPNKSNITLPTQFKVPVDCDAIVGDAETDIGDPSIPRYPPKRLEKYYTLNGLIPIRYDVWFNQTYVGTDAKNNIWTEEFFKPITDKIERNFPKKRPMASYGMQPNEFVTNLKAHVDFNGKRVLVIGTEYPWLEATALWLGAKHVTTLEYGKIFNQHPKVTALLPSEFRQQYQEGTLGQFDIVLSFSSLEHPGLGRYGDALNPWGDMIAVARAYCVTKPGGFLGLGMPSDNRKDEVIFNEARSYGPIRWSLISTNWQQVDGEHQRNVLSKSRKRHTSYVFQKPLAE